MNSVGLFKLVANTTLLQKYYNCEFVEQLSNLIPLENNKNSILTGCDSIMEVFIEINLPILSNIKKDIYWKNNLLLHLIEKIEISFYCGKTLLIDKNKINLLLSELEKSIDKKSLFYNLSEDERKKMSLKQIKIYLPLKLGNLVKNPSEIFIVLGNPMHIKIEMSFDNLLENDNFSVDNITFGVKFLGRFYDWPKRNDIIQNFSNISNNQLYF